MEGTGNTGHQHWRHDAPGGSGTPCVAPVLLRALVDEATRHGVPVLPLFRGLGFAPDDLDAPDFAVTHQEATQVLRRGLRTLTQPSLGLQLGQRCRMTHGGALALGLMASSTLCAALDLLLRFPAAAGLLVDLHLTREPDHYALVAEVPTGLQDVGHFLVDKLFAGLVRQHRQLCDAPLAPQLVELMRPPPPDFLTYEQHFRCTVRFNATGNRLLLPLQWLRLPLPTASTMSLRLANGLLEKQTQQLQGMSPLGLAAARAIKAALPAVLTAAQLASALHLSERSLRRRLAAERLGFSALLDEARHARAVALLDTGKLAIDDVALATGFGDARSFRRAFRRWTGRPPSQWGPQADITPDDPP